MKRGVNVLESLGERCYLHDTRMQSVELEDRWDLLRDSFEVVCTSVLDNDPIELQRNNNFREIGLLAYALSYTSFDTVFTTEM